MKGFSFSLLVFSVFLFFLCETQAQHLWVVYHNHNFNDTRHIIANSSLIWNKNGFADQVGDTYLPITWGPSPIEYNGKLYIFRQGTSTYNPNAILYTTYDGENYSADTQIPNVSSTFKLSPVVFNGQLYVFYQGEENDGTAWYSVYDSTTGIWQNAQQISGVSLINSPGAVVVGDLIYFFYSTSSNEIHYRIFDGSVWDPIDVTFSGVATINSPAPVVFQGSLYVFFQADDGFHLSYVNTNSDGTWSSVTSVPNMGLSAAPSPVVVGTSLFVFHQDGQSLGQLWYNTLLSPLASWSGDQIITGISINDSPGVAWIDF